MVHVARRYSSVLAGVVGRGESWDAPSITCVPDRSASHVQSTMGGRAVA